MRRSAGVRVAVGAAASGDRGAVILRDLRTAFGRGRCIPCRTVRFRIATRAGPGRTPRRWRAPWARRGAGLSPFRGFCSFAYTLVPAYRERHAAASRRDGRCARHMIRVFVALPPRAPRNFLGAENAHISLTRGSAPLPVRDRHGACSSLVHRSHPCPECCIDSPPLAGTRCPAREAGAV